MNKLDFIAFLESVPTFMEMGLVEIIYVPNIMEGNVYGHVPVN